MISQRMLKMESSTSMTVRRNKKVISGVLIEICSELKCDIGDIMELDLDKSSEEES